MKTRVPAEELYGIATTTYDIVASGVLASCKFDDDDVVESMLPFLSAVSYFS